MTLGFGNALGHALDVEAHFPTALWIYTAAFAAYIAFAVYFAAHYQKRSALITRPHLVLLFALASACVGRLAVLSVKPCDDIYRFAFEAKVTRAGLDPTVHAPSSPAVAHLRQGTDSLINHPHLASVYPRIAQASFRLGFPEQESGWRWRAMLGLADLAGMALIWQVSPLAAVLYGLNPLLIFEGVGRGHFEPLVLLVMIMAWRASRARLDAVFGLCLALGISLKPQVVLLTIPWLLTGAWRRPKAYLALGLMLIATLDTYFSIGSTLEAFLRQGQYNSALPWLWNSLWSFVWPDGPLVNTGWALTPVLLPAVALWVFVQGRAWPMQWPFERMALWLFATLLLTSTTVHPWYALWLLPFAALRRDMYWLALTATAIAGLWPYWLQSRGETWHEIAALRWVMYLPPFAVWIVASFSRWSSPSYPPSMKSAA